MRPKQARPFFWAFCRLVSIAAVNHLCYNRSWLKIYIDTGDNLGQYIWQNPEQHSFNEVKHSLIAVGFEWTENFPPSVKWLRLTLSHRNIRLIIRDTSWCRSLKPSRVDEKKLISLEKALKTLVFLPRCACVCRRQTNRLSTQCRDAYRGNCYDCSKAVIISWILFGSDSCLFPNNQTNVLKQTCRLRTDKTQSNVMKRDLA